MQLRGAVTVTLDNGKTITIADGQTSGSVDVTVAADEDVYLDATSMSAAITSAQVVTSKALVLIVTTITDAVLTALQLIGDGEATSMTVASFDRNR